MGSIIEPQALQDPWRMLLHARSASRRLFRSGEMEQVAFLSPRGERVKGFSQVGVCV